MWMSSCASPFCLVVVCVALILIVKMLIFRILDRFTIDNPHCKHVIITGCDTGFGHKLAMQLDVLGMIVIATTLTEEGAERLREKTSTRMICLQMDVSDPESVQRLVNIVKQKLPAGQGLWGLVNNAGVMGMPVPMSWLRTADFETCIGVNLVGMIDVTLKCLPLIMLARGRIINMSSAAGHIGFIGPYSTSKYGVEGFSDSLRVEMKTWGVSVSTIVPGFFDTDIVNSTILKNIFNKAWHRLDSRTQALYGTSFLSKCLDNIEKTRSFGSTDLNKVTDSMEHALTARFPYAHYVVGTDARWLWIPLSYLPACLQDQFLYQFYVKKFIRPDNPNMATFAE